MDNRWISKIKGSKPFNIMIGITAILTALVTFTDTIERVSSKVDTWFGDKKPSQEIIVSSMADTISNTSKPSDNASNESKITVISPFDTSLESPGTPSVSSTSLDIPIVSPKQAFKAYNSKHITTITEYSHPISISKNKFIMDLSVLSKTFDTTIKPVNEYYINKRGVLYEINPSNSYLKSLEKGELASSNLSINNLGLPLFDVKTVNNSEETIFITKAIFRIKKSIQDSTPYFKKKHGDGFKIPIQNIGYGPAMNAELKLDITDSTGITKSHKIEIDTIKNYCNTCDVSNILKIYNVNVDFFNGNFSNSITPEIQQQARGAFKNTYVPIDATLSYQAKDLNNKLQNYSFRFKHKVKLKLETDVAMAMSMNLPSKTYDLKLELNNEDYARTINVSQVLSPKGFDRFQIKLFADATSRHLFDLIIVYNDGQSLTFENLALNYFKPRDVY